MRVVVALDGSRLDPSEPVLRADDLGVTRGDGVFETILVSAGHPRELEAHLARFARSARILDMPAPDERAYRACVQHVIDAWASSARRAGELAVKLVHTRGIDGGDGTPSGYALGMEIADWALAQRSTGVSAVTLERGIDGSLAARAPWLLLGAKTLSYAPNMAALREAERRGVDEVVFTATDGTALEGPTSSVVLAGGHTLRTPPPDAGILAGTTQGALFAEAERAGWETRVEPIPSSDLYTADALLLCSAVRTITRVHTLDGKTLPESAVLHRELAALYESHYR
jgi:4-amino-4-deoxychorismate lyase